MNPSRRMLRSVAMTLLLAFMLVPVGPVLAIDPQEFDSPEQEARYQAMIEELRCLVCQNQNIADSNAPLAMDLRDIVLEQMRLGKSDEEIRIFLVERYGDFVLYRPPVKSSTAILWIGPAVFVLIGAFLFVVAFRRHAKADPKKIADPDQDELDRRLAEMEKDHP